MAPDRVTAGLALSMPLLCLRAATAMLLLSGGWMGQGTNMAFIVGIGMPAQSRPADPRLFMEKLQILRQPIGQRILATPVSMTSPSGGARDILLDWNRSAALSFLVCSRASSCPKLIGESRA